MADLLVTGILLLIIGAAAVYIWKAKKRGVKCIGCPSAGKCSGKEGHTVCSCGCHSAEKIGNFRESPHFGKGVGLLYKTQEME